MELNGTEWLYLDDYSYENISSDGHHSESTYHSGTSRVGLILLSTVLGLILNTLSFVVVYRGRHIEQSIRTQLLNVIVSDFLFSIAITFSEHVVNPSKVIHTVSLCKFTWFLLMGCVYSTIIWRIGLGIERTVLLYRSPHNLSYNKSVEIAVISVIWLLGFIFPIYYAADVSIYTWYDSRGQKRSQCHLLASVALWIHTMTQNFPVLVLAAVYGVLAQKLLTSSIYRRLATQDHQISPKSKQTIRMLIADAVGLLLTWTPVGILTIIFLTGLNFEHWQRMELAYVVTHLIFVTKSFTTPMIYYCSNPAYRKDVRLLFQCCCKKRDADEEDTVAVVRDDDNEYHLVQDES